MKKTIRNLMIGTTALLGAGYIVKKIMKIKNEKNLIQEAKIEETNKLNKDTTVYHTVGVIVKENDKVKVKDMKELKDSSKTAV